VATTFLTSFGTEAVVDFDGVAESIFESGLNPTPFFAFILNAYDTPFVNPVTCAFVASAATVFLKKSSVPTCQ